MVLLSSGHNTSFLKLEIAVSQSNPNSRSHTSFFPELSRPLTSPITSPAQVFLHPSRNVLI
uniref:Uncharacterized protein n=1 Tax=Dicentrarchus labrax TaxID=13489 RepID=A0A8P4GHB5_DICLA